MEPQNKECLIELSYQLENNKNPRNLKRAGKYNSKLIIQKNRFVLSKLHNICAL